MTTIPTTSETAEGRSGAASGFLRGLVGRSARSARSERAVWAAAAGWLGLAALTLASGSRTGWLVPAYLVPLAVAAVLLVASTRAGGRRDRVFIGSFAAFSLLTLAGYVAASLTKTPWSVAGPSFSDGLFFAGYAALVPGLVVGLRPLGRLGASVVWFDAALVTGTLGYAGYVLLLEPALRKPTAAILVAAAYPLLDLAVLAAFVPIVLGLRAAPRGAGLLLGSFAAAIVADAAYAYFRLHGGSVFQTWFTLGYQVQLLLLALGGYQAYRQRAPRAEARVRTPDLGLSLALAGFAATLVLLAHDTLRGASTRPERVGFAAIVVLLIGRMLLADRDLRRVERAERERGEELEKLVAARTGELRRSREGSIRRLAEVIGLRDQETGEHIERIALYAALLATRAGMAPDDVELLRIAAPLHDIGKIALPDSILRNPGALSDGERAAMQQHTIYGHRLLADSGQEVLDLAAELALTHHERWDGGGYPKGLAGEAIPLVGRILAICDVFDALSSDRVYRAALPLDEVLHIMRDGHGTQFDPELLDLFLTALPAVIRLRDSTAGIGLGDVA